MKIYIFEVEEWEKAHFARLQGQHEVVFVPDPLNKDNVGSYQDADIVSVFIYSQLNQEVLAQLPHLKLIATRSTGYDHIDVAAASEKGVIVCNVPVYGDHTVAEHTFGLLLMISHKLDEAVNRTRRGDFSLQGLRGFDLMGKTLGVIGTGHIGQCVIQIAKGFQMSVIAYDIKPDPDLAARLGFEYVPLDELYQNSDIISLHVPSTPATKKMINEAAFAKMKQGVVLINTARGDLIDVTALLRALSTGRVRAVGLDVLPEEPAIREEAELLRKVFQRQHPLDEILADHILLRMRNVYITPHSAFNTQEAVERILTTTCDNILSFIASKPQNIVSP